MKTCQLKKNESVQLLSLRTIDGDTLYLKFRNVITGAFLDTPTKSYDFLGDVVLSQCINGSLIFALEYGSPYIKGCLVTGWENGFKGKNSPEGFCFAERNIPEAVWFGKNNILIIIRNQMDVGTWKGKYIIAKWHLNRSQFGIRIDHDLASISDHSLASQSITIWHASDH
ncbi:hypothetical protein [Escherichia coli]|uniref:hypothetical protein n=1 Tax=Escherichia coli TaxID=562 RepID=UPI0034658E0D